MEDIIKKAYNLGIQEYEKSLEKLATLYNINSEALHKDLNKFKEANKMNQYEQALMKTANAYGVDPVLLDDALRKEANIGDIIRGAAGTVRDAAGAVGQKAQGALGTAAQKMPGGKAGLAGAGLAGAGALGAGAYGLSQLGDDEEEQEKEAALALQKLANAYGLNPAIVDQALTKEAASIDPGAATGGAFLGAPGAAAGGAISAPEGQRGRAAAGGALGNIGGTLAGGLGGGALGTGLGALGGRLAGSTGAGAMLGGTAGAGLGGLVGGAAGAGYGAQRARQDEEEQVKESAAEFADALTKVAQAHGLNPEGLYNHLEKNAADRAAGQEAATQEQMESENTVVDKGRQAINRVGQFAQSGAGTAAAGAGGLGAGALLGRRLGSLGNLGGVQNQVGTMQGAGRRLRGLAGQAFGGLQQAQQRMPGSGLQQAAAGAGAVGAGLGIRELLRRRRGQQGQQKQAAAEEESAVAKKKRQAAENLGISVEELEDLIAAAQ